MRARMVESRSCVQREEVYRWFSALTSARRAEFLCGLLDLCVPIELRFIGACLEDLARKDYHCLRDAEIKANNPADLAALTNITDEVVRSRLLVSLALLGSDNREAAGVLFRTLTHIDSVINNYGLPLSDGRTEEQFLLLFTMASNHPAFSFHQKQVLRQQLGQIQDLLQASKGGGEASAAGPAGARAAVCYPLHTRQATSPPQAVASLGAACHAHCSCWNKSQTREAETPSGVTLEPGDHDLSAHPDLRPPTLPPPAGHPYPPSSAGQNAAATKSHQGKPGKAVIERVALRGMSGKGEDATDCVFEVSWSDGFVSSVSRTQQEVAELISQLSQVFPEEELEVDPRCLAALSGPVLQSRCVQLFFASSRPLSPRQPSSPSSSTASTCTLTCSSDLSCLLQYRGANRAVYRVASVQPVISTNNSVSTRSTPHISSFPPPLPPSIHPPMHSLPTSALPPHIQAPPTRSLAPSEASSQLHHTYAQLQHHLHPHGGAQPALHSPHSQPRSQPHTLQPAAPTQSSKPEQNGILDWLRRLRLHKYYPVFKQLTMEEFLALTEEDLNKYDLTQGAKKKLKTQLELQKLADREMKMEKRPCSGIARVTPTNHVGPSAAELRVEVDSVSHHQQASTDSNSSSGYSSSSCSPRTPLCCDSAFDRVRDMHRRVSGPSAADSGAPEKSVFMVNSSCPTASTRPTAQVLPVQTDLTPPLPPSCSSHLPFGVPQASFHQLPSYPQSLLSPVSVRILSSPRKPRPLCTDVGGASFPSALGGEGRLENLFSGLSVDGSSTPRESCHERSASAVDLMVETSSAPTSTSNSLHHVSQPPLLFHLSSSCPPTSPSFSSSFSSSKSSSQSDNPGPPGGFVSTVTGSSVPVAAVPGNVYFPPQPTSSPSPCTSSSSLDQRSGHGLSLCVCSSCGCHGNCGTYSALPGYAAASYLQPFSSGSSLFTLAPLLHLTPLVSSSSAAGYAAPPFSYPMMGPPPAYRRSLASHDPQPGFGFYSPHSIMGNGGQKRTAGNLSCFNCGTSGHRADDCKQPAAESLQRAPFRLKFSPQSDTKDSTD
ncbi:Zinc finger CCHC domain-containing protein 14 [Oryzias melastigma]|uniref:Zinc finger CCHC domain-containing protein 14 n=1 Tax=Oryzias melastigma TaxID=30732 RepID=A0A834KYR9_ORYME|nr:Zinc finger CCHC domain-containing protein 14 [Oryzias melastigma]